jgi:hypothetical protein
MASITVNEQEQAIQPFLAAVDGITTAQYDYPDDVQTRELPMIITSPGEASYDERADGKPGHRVRRQWTALLLVKETSKGREYQAEREAKPFLTTVPDAIAPHPRVKLPDGRAFGLELHRGSDRGATVVTYNERLYAGTVFTFYTETLTRIDPS